MALYSVGTPPEGFLLLTVDPEEESSVSAATPSLTFDTTERFGFLLVVWSAKAPTEQKEWSRFVHRVYVLCNADETTCLLSVALRQGKVDTPHEVLVWLPSVLKECSVTWILVILVYFEQ